MISYLPLNMLHVIVSVRLNIPAWQTNLSNKCPILRDTIVVAMDTRCLGGPDDSTTVIDMGFDLAGFVGFPDIKTLIG